MKKAEKESIRIARLINEFLSGYVQTHITNSENTLRSYRMALSLYLAFLEEAESVTAESLSLKHFETQYIEKWIEWLSDVRSCSPATCNNRLGSLRTFLRFISDRSLEYLYLYEEATNIPLIKTPKAKVKGLSNEAVKAIFAIPDTSTMTGVRDYVLMLVMYSTAARINEVLSIKLKDIYLKASKPYINIIGKGNKARTLYILPKVVNSIEKYLRIYHESSEDSEAYLFYSKIRGPHEKITQPAVDKRLKAIAAKARLKCTDVPSNLHAHQFRHAKASHWLEKGMNIAQISFLLGHENVETTMKYLDISLEEERKALQTLENDIERKTRPKWKASNKTLRSLCAL